MDPKTNINEEVQLRMLKKLELNKCFRHCGIALSILVVSIVVDITLIEHLLGEIKIVHIFEYKNYRIALYLIQGLGILFGIWNFYRLKHIRRNEIKKIGKSIDRKNDLINHLMNLCNEAEKYTNDKSNFLINISHEIKTPLTVILGTIQLMQNKSLEDNNYLQKSLYNYNQIIKHNCYRLIRLVNNFLDVVKLESGHMRNKFINCNIVYLVEEITQSVILYARNKNLTLLFDTEEEEIITVVDIDKIERIVLNLLSNAIKFTPKGGSILVRVRKEKEVVAIAVKDSGIGIPNDMVDKIFDRFEQASNALVWNQEGSGIGLSLVKSFVELHDGTIDVFSEVGKGSEFIVKLPIKIIELNDQNQDCVEAKDMQEKIINAINIELSNIYSVAE